MNKKVLIGLMFVVTVVVIGFVIFFNKIKIKNFDNELYTFKYDTTWKLETNEDLVLKHKKSKATLTFKYRELENYFVDISLSDMIGEIIDGVLEQNNDYKLISGQNDISGDYEGFSYLFEKDDEQALVNVYKKDKKLVIMYYVCDSNYYDIVLDSVDYILNNLVIK